MDDYCWAHILVSEPSEILLFYEQYPNFGLAADYHS